MARKIGIIGAMNIEVELLKARLYEENSEKDLIIRELGGVTYYEGTIGGVYVVVVKSGIGKVNAALCAQRLILQFGVTHIINTGAAGSMAHGLRVLDYVVSSEALYHDFDTQGFGYKPTEIPQMKKSVFPADRTLVGFAKKAFAELGECEGHKMIEGRIASGDQFISEKSVKSHINEICSPACVEMEGAAVAHACYLDNIPFVVIRCMSDMAEDIVKQDYEFNEEKSAKMSSLLVIKMLELMEEAKN